jgi:hypothetical protein
MFTTRRSSFSGTTREPARSRPRPNSLSSLDLPALPVTFYKFLTIASQIQTLVEADRVFEAEQQIRQLEDRLEDLFSLIWTKSIPSLNVLRRWNQRQTLALLLIKSPNADQKMTT